MSKSAENENIIFLKNNIEKKKNINIFKYFRLNNIKSFQNINMTKIILCYRFIFFFIVLFLYFLTFNCENLTNDEEIFYKGVNKNYLKSKIIKKFNLYIKLCNGNKLINKFNNSLIKNPKISVIMPIYNGGKYLNYSLRSIQNQNLIDIEIIIIDDYSCDNSITIIEKFMKEDQRIRLIKNKKNKKILYSKSIAALNSNGEYIIELDQDDMFIRDDVFNMLYNEAISHNLDLVQIRDFVKNNFFFYRITLVNQPFIHYIYPKKTHYKYQPELKNKLFIEGNNYLLWCLLIKTDLYKYSIYQLWPIIINYQIIFNEDYLITSMIVQFAQNFKYINKFGLIHLAHSNSTSNDYYKNNEFYLSFYFFLFYLYDYYIKNNLPNIKIIINYIYTDIKSFCKGYKLYPEMFDSIIRIILNNDYLTNVEKKNLLNDISEYNININKYKIFNSYKYLMNENEYKNIFFFQNSIQKMEIQNNINKEKILFNKKFKISIIIYCSEFNYLNKTIYSILNQINYDYEIIIVYDNNDKNELNYIRNLTNMQENIKIVDNKMNKGIMYSYSKCILDSFGEYILLLQSGYVLAKNDILSFLYNTSKRNNLDILEFNLLINNHEYIKNNSLSIYKCSHFKRKKYLNTLKTVEEYKDIDQEIELLFNKLIKSNILKKIVNKYNLLNYNNNVYNYYEKILFFLLDKYKLKFKHIDMNGVIQFNINIKLLNIEKFTNNKNQVFHDTIFYINFLFDNSENTFLNKKYVFNEFVNKLSIIFNKFDIATQNSLKLLDKFINCKYINKEDKEELKFFYYSLIN